MCSSGTARPAAPARATVVPRIGCLCVYTTKFTYIPFYTSFHAQALWLANLLQQTNCVNPIALQFASLLQHSHGYTMNNTQAPGQFYFHASG